jgi:hypothetical protein
VADTFASLEKYLGEHEIDYNQTKLILGATLDIDPKTERSTDAEANKLFTREYRKGFALPEVG